MANETLTDKAWNTLFQKLPIIEDVEINGMFRISAEQIKRISGREARLMTKFDSSKQLPKIFEKNKLAILPNTRGSYTIAKFKAYQDYNYEILKPELITFPGNIQSVRPEDITSEAVALNVAKLTGMVDGVLESEEDFQSVPTISGRLGSGDFNFNIKTKDKKDLQMVINNSQLEVDATYENIDKIAIFEAKNKQPIDFMIRQLYYPYRVFGNKGITKSIVPIFFTYVDDVFSFTIYKFENDMEYTSIKKVKQYSYILNEELNLTIDKVKYIANNVELLEETAKFPQADSFARVLDMLEHLNIPKDKFELAMDYEFNDRQGAYYGDALVYLGYAEKNNSDKKYFLTEKGKKIERLGNTDRRNESVIKDILSHSPFNKAFRKYFENGCEFDRAYRGVIAEIVLEEGLNIGEESTAERRTSSVIQWIKWIIRITE